MLPKNYSFMNHIYYIFYEKVLVLDKSWYAINLTQTTSFHVLSTVKLHE